MNKFEVNELLDQYIGLLTDKQQEICEEYFQNDLSYQEIAEEMNISRSAVYDTIKRSKEELMHYEEVLHCNAFQKERVKIYKKILEETDEDKIHHLIHTLIEKEESGNYE